MEKVNYYRPTLKLPHEAQKLLRLNSYEFDVDSPEAAKHVLTRIASELANQECRIMFAYELAAIIEVGMAC